MRPRERSFSVYMPCGSSNWTERGVHSVLPPMPLLAILSRQYYNPMFRFVGERLTYILTKLIGYYSLRAAGSLRRTVRHPASAAHAAPLSRYQSPASHYLRSYAGSTLCGPPQQSQQRSLPLLYEWSIWSFWMLSFIVRHRAGARTLDGALPLHGYIRPSNPLQAVTSSPLLPIRMEVSQMEGMSLWGQLLIVFSYPSVLFLSAIKLIILLTALGTPSVS